ncbi:hypothetical protein JKP88DRAFT_247076 [Tribonema minus]|uniref:Uncharacterized protein n=1 Tax=Tribonema minus TaxID=303371 RepID=A0A835Z0Y1_9STRA|nr:hypothetical protein JKP88DRAFT_247076 [Tribonema minus]
MLVSVALWRDYYDSSQSSPNTKSLQDFSHDDRLPLYCGRCILPASTFAATRMDPGAAAALQLLRPQQHSSATRQKHQDEAETICLCTVWPSSSQHEQHALVDARTVLHRRKAYAALVPELAFPDLAARGRNAGTHSGPRVALLLPLPHTLPVASSLQLTLRQQPLQPSATPPTPVDLTCPSLTAMVKRSLRQLCVCSGAAVAVPCTADCCITATVTGGGGGGAARGSDAWWIGLSTVILADTEDDDDACDGVSALEVLEQPREEEQGAAAAVLPQQQQRAPRASSSGVADALLELILLPVVAPIATAFIPRHVRALVEVVV